MTTEEKIYDKFMDKECIDLCNKLNSLSDIETTESCCGHCRDPYMIFFNCYDFIRLGKLFRCVNRNYSDGKWRIEAEGSDTQPCNEFVLISKEPFNSTEEMMKSVNDLIENIDYWENPTFDNYFNNNGLNKTNAEKADVICKKHIFDSNHFDCCMEMAEWKDEQFAQEKQQWIEKVCELMQHWILEHDYVDIMELEDYIKQKMDDL